MNFGIVEDEDNFIIKNSNIDEKEYFKPKYIEILEHTKSALGLDISKHSTGVVMWENGELSYAIIDVGFAEDEAEMRQAFEEELSKILQNKNFERVYVEDVFDGDKSFTAVRQLVTLNTVPEDLLKEGIFSTNNFKKDGNGVWKKELRTYYKPKGNLKPKLEIREILKFLDFDIESLERFNIMGKKDRDQDLLDALGTILGGITRDIINVDKTNNCKLTIKDMKVWYCNSIDEYEACYNEDEDFNIIDINKNYKSEINKAIKETYGEIILVSEVNTDLLGRFAMDYNIPIDNENICIVVQPLKIKKPKKKKTKAIIIR